MTTELGDKRIIMIHGLASKPPAEDVHEFWRRCLVENIRIDDPELASELDDTPEVFSSAYWANAVPHHIEDDRAYVRKLEVQVDTVINERRTEREFHVGRGERFKAFFKDRGLDVVDFFSNALTIKDNVTRGLLREVELYSRDQYIAAAIRRPLEYELRRAWDEGCQVALLSHSMGTFIAFDVLWRFSHRNEPGLVPYRKKRVSLFATMGSPLGDNVIQDLLFADHHKDAGKRSFPTNIDRWHNYAALGDVVSHDSELDDDFFEPMRELKLLARKPGHRAIDYRKLHNPFEVVTHSGNRKRSKRNPHKSYGYLVQPRLGTWVADFLQDQLR